MGEAEFDRLMAPLGPWPPSGSTIPLALAVSGGADSLALAWLARRWAAARRLPLRALVVDHRLRPASGAEAAQAALVLHGLGIPATILPLHGLLPGAGLAERARAARYAALAAACRAAGAIDLLLGHHAGDQAETVLMRGRAGSGPDGRAGMALLVETADLRLLRPLLPVAPARLRAVLAGAGVAWIEDPSNHDRRAQRTRLRDELRRSGEAPALLSEAAACARGRLARRHRDDRALARAASLRPEGFALLPEALLPAAAMADLLRAIGGGRHRPGLAAVESLLRRPRAATLAGARLMPAGRLGPGWLLLREAAAIAPALPAAEDACWDRRYRLAGPVPAAGLEIGALGAAAATLRRHSALPAAVLETLPALRRDGRLLAVPHLGWSADPSLAAARFRFQPPSPAATAGLFADP